MRFLLTLLAAAFLALPASAETTMQPTAPRLSMEKRFEQANITNDGHLTLEQAKAHYKSVARKFTAIDHDRKGYVTVDDIKTYNKARRALHRQSADSRGVPNG